MLFRRVGSGLITGVDEVLTEMVVSHCASDFIWMRRQKSLCQERKLAGACRKSPKLLQELQDLTSLTAHGFGLLDPPPAESRSNPHHRRVVRQIVSKRFHRAIPQRQTGIERIEHRLDWPILVTAFPATSQNLQLFLVLHVLNHLLQRTQLSEFVKTMLQ